MWTNFVSEIVAHKQREHMHLATKFN